MGSCVFSEEGTSKVLANTLRHFDNIRYDVGNWVIMPNHVHVVVTPKDGYELHKKLHAWKTYSARQINKQLEQRGKLWQEESFDQIIRSEVHHYHVAKYIGNNPTKAGITVHHASWLEGQQPI
jgi:REP element-mobilizing transposase RayT